MANRERGSGGPGNRLRGRALTLRRRDEGQAVTEFALVLPLLAGLVLIMVLLGKSLYAYIQVTHSANEGARLAAVNQPQSQSLAAYLRSVAALPGGATVAICYPNGTQNVGDPVQVDVFASGSWVPVINIGQIKSSATMRLEQSTSTNSNLSATSTFNSATGMCNT